MKIAVATRDWAHVAGHAGKARSWLVWDLFDHRAGRTLSPPVRIELAPDEVFHHFTDDRPHPLDGVAVVLAGSAGDGFVRHMQKRGTVVMLTGETDPEAAIARVLAGEALPDPRFDVTTTLCKIRDLFSRH